MTQNPLVSVVIASYNMEEYLPLAIQSVLSQSYSNIELHVVDDGSTDNTKEELTIFKNDPRFNYYRQVNSGQASAKNLGIEKAKADYIAFLDADDMWHPQKIEKQMPLFETSEKTGVVYTGFTYINEKSEVLFTPKLHCYSGRITGQLLIENIVPFNTTIVRRACFDRVGPFDESLSMGIDYDLWLRISTKYDFDCLNESLMYYRVWSGQMSRNVEGRYKWGIEIMNKFLEEHPGLIDNRIVKRAWAHTYTGKGAALLYHRGDYGGGIKAFTQALRYKADYWPAWKEIIMAFPRVLKNRINKRKTNH